MIPFINESLNFLKKHRTKIVIASGIAIATGVCFYLYNDNQVENQEEDKLTTTSPPKVLLDESSKSKIILKINSNFRYSCIYLLPTVRLNIIDISEVNNTIKLVRALKSLNSPNSPPKVSIQDNGKSEMDLWEEIKLASISIFFLVIYMTSISSILLKIQLYLLARSIAEQNHVDIAINEDLFQILIEGTFSNLFDKDKMSQLYSKIKSSTQVVFDDWKVSEKLSIDYVEFEEKLLEIKDQVEDGFLNYFVQSSFGNFSFLNFI